MLKLQTELTSALLEAAGRLTDEESGREGWAVKARETAKTCKPLSLIASLAGAVLEEQGYVQVRGFPLTSAVPLFHAFATLLGEPYVDPAIGSATIPAHVRPGEALMGNQLRRLPLHTDYSMMKHPPRLTMSFCVQPDAIPGFGAVFVSDIESLCFGVESEPWIVDLMTVPLPFASLTAQEEVDVIDSPIVSRDPVHNTFLVRYHRTRIRQGFQYRGSEPTPEQCSVMLNFERMAQSSIQVLHPEAGDITVIDNHRTVHGRERCSVEVTADGMITGRQMMFLFAY